jgi:hypothetical protein
MRRSQARNQVKLSRSARRAAEICDMIACGDGLDAISDFASPRTKVFRIAYRACAVALDKFADEFVDDTQRALWARLSYVETRRACWAEAAQLIREGLCER